MARAIGGVPWRLRDGCSIVLWCDERSAAQVRVHKAFWEAVAKATAQADVGRE